VKGAAEGGEEVAKKLTTGTKEGAVGIKEGTTVAAKGLLKEEAQVGLKSGAKLIGKKALKFVPGVGIAIGVVLVTKDLKAGDRGAAAWDAAEAVPIAGDIVGLGHLGLVAGSSDVAAEHGKAVADVETRVLTSAGVSPEHAQQYAYVSGGFIAATSAVTVAPYIAANRKLQEAGKALGEWIMK
jgi:hypothetical protein